MSTARPIASAELGRLGLAEEFQPPDRFRTSFNEVERVKAEQMMVALRRNDWVQKKAAAELGLKPASFNKWLKRFGLLQEVRMKRRQARAASSGSVG